MADVCVFSPSLEKERPILQALSSIKSRLGGAWDFPPPTQGSRPAPGPALLILTASLGFGTHTSCSWGQSPSHSGEIKGLFHATSFLCISSFDKSYSNNKNIFFHRIQFLNIFLAQSVQKIPKHKHMPLHLHGPDQCNSLGAIIL